MPHNIRTPLLDLVSDLRGDLGKFAVEGCPFGLKFLGGGEAIFSHLVEVGAVLLAQRTLHLAGAPDNAKTNHRV